MRFFNRVTLQTPESVELEFTLAGIGNRALALLIDYTVLSVILIVFIFAWSFFSIQLLNFSSNLGVWLLAIALIVGFFIYTGYFVFFETLWQGQTPGKRFTKIRVIRDDGPPIGLQQATLRSLTRPFDDIFLGAFLIMLGRREKRLGDWAAGTIVIQAEPPVAAATFAFSEQAQLLAEKLLQTTDFSQLLPDDFAVIREYLQRRWAMAPKARVQLSLRLATQVQTVIALEALPATGTPDVFLEAVYLAYQRSFES